MIVDLRNLSIFILIIFKWIRIWSEPNLIQSICDVSTRFAGYHLIDPSSLFTVRSHDGLILIQMN